MLKSLEMTGFRAFESYALDGLSRVDLVVGRNNSGKTSVLEAVDLLVSRGSPASIAESAQRREEMRPVEWRPGFRRVASIAHLFYGHGCEPGDKLQLHGSRGLGRVTVELRSLDDLEDAVLSEMLDDFDDRLPPEASPAMGLAISLDLEKKPEFIFPVTENGLLIRDVRSRWMNRPSARFLSLTSTEPPFLSEAWNALVTDGREKEVVEDMKLLMPDIDSIHFLTSGGMPRGGGIVVGLRDGGSRYPLGTFGDGMRRLLLLRLALATGSRFLTRRRQSSCRLRGLSRMWRS